jgi:hypothetical protein
MTAKSQTQMKKGGKNVTTSAHRKERYAFYKAHTYPVNKLKRIIQSCGTKFAQKWAQGHSSLGILARLLK